MNWKYATVARVDLEKRRLERREREREGLSWREELELVRIMIRERRWIGRREARAVLRAEAAGQDAGQDATAGGDGQTAAAGTGTGRIEATGIDSVPGGNGEEEGVIKQTASESVSEGIDKCIRERDKFMVKFSFFFLLSSY